MTVDGNFEAKELKMQREQLEGSVKELDKLEGELKSAAKEEKQNWERFRSPSWYFHANIDMLLKTAFLALCIMLQDLSYVVPVVWIFNEIRSPNFPRFCSILTNSYKKLSYVNRALMSITVLSLSTWEYRLFLTWGYIASATWTCYIQALHCTVVFQCMLLKRFHKSLKSKVALAPTLKRSLMSSATSVAACFRFCWKSALTCKCWPLAFTTIVLYCLPTPSIYVHPSPFGKSTFLQRHAEVNFYCKSSFPSTI